MLIILGTHKNNSISSTSIGSKPQLKIAGKVKAKVLLGTLPLIKVINQRELYEEMLDFDCNADVFVGDGTEGYVALLNWLFHHVKHGTRTYDFLHDQYDEFILVASEFYTNINESLPTFGTLLLYTNFFENTSIYQFLAKFWDKNSIVLFETSSSLVTYLPGMFEPDIFAITFLLEGSVAKDSTLKDLIVENISPSQSQADNELSANIIQNTIDLTVNSNTVEPIKNNHDKLITKITSTILQYTQHSFLGIRLPYFVLTCIAFTIGGFILTQYPELIVNGHIVNNASLLVSNILTRLVSIGAITLSQMEIETIKTNIHYFFEFKRLNDAIPVQ